MTPDKSRVPQNPHVAFSTPVPLPLIYAFGVVAVGVLGWTPRCSAA